MRDRGSPCAAWLRPVDRHGPNRQCAGDCGRDRLASCGTARSDAEQRARASDGEIAILTAQLRDAKARSTESDLKLVEALKDGQEAQHRVVAALEEAQKLANANVERAKERLECLQIHVARLPETEQKTALQLVKKAGTHTLTFDEYPTFERLLGGDLARLVWPGLDEVRYESVRRQAKEDPSQEPMLRQLVPKAFANDGANKAP